MLRHLPTRHWSRSLSTWCVVAGVILSVGALSPTRQVTGLEDLTRDWRFMLRGPRPIQVPIIVIEIDQETLDDKEKFGEPMIFWGRHHARVFETLHTLGARAIGFDVIQPLSLADSDYIDSNPDQAEAQALAGIPEMVLAYSRSWSPSGQLMETLPNNHLTTALTIGGGRRGFTNAPPDPDGVVRHSTLADNDGSLAFALAVAAVATGQEPKFEADAVLLGERRLALDSSQRCIINYVGPNETFPRISYRDLLRRPSAFRKQIKNSICLIGATSFGLQDYHQVPMAQRRDGRVENLMAGIEIHANTVHTILTGGGIHRPGVGMTWLLIVLAVAVSTPLCWLRKIYFVVPCLIALTASWTLICLLSFVHHGWQLPLVPVVLAVATNQFLLTVVRLRRENSHKQWVEDLFGRYTSPQVLDHLMHTPGAIDLGGRRQIVTVLFSDIRGFTEMSEKMEPEQVVNLLNQYLEKMVEIVFANDGTVDKYIGDAIMAVYNWHIEQPDHAARAVRTAVQMQEQIKAAAQEWQSAGLPSLSVGIGIHTGPAVLGNIGSPRRMEQTAIGDTVNVASRLEGLNKELGKRLGSNILISETTKSALNDSFTVVPAGETEIRGRQEKIKVYAII